MDKREETGSKISYYFGSMIIIFILTFSMTYRKYMSGSDFQPHADMALELNRYIFQYMREYTSYPLWHMVVKFIYKIFGFGIETSTACATALFNCLAGGGSCMYGITWATDRRRLR